MNSLQFDPPVSGLSRRPAWNLEFQAGFLFRYFRELLPMHLFSKKPFRTEGNPLYSCVCVTFVGAATTNRRGTPVVPANVKWIIQYGATDLTSRSLRKGNRRGMLVMPAEVKWIIQRYAADPTSGSLQHADATSASLREANLTSGALRNALR